MLRKEGGFSCDRCGTKGNVKRKVVPSSGQDLCEVCVRKIANKARFSKGGLLNVKSDIEHVVNERNKTPSKDYGYR